MSKTCTQDSRSSLHSHDYELTPECSCTFRRASLRDWPPPASSPWEPTKGKVTSSHSHGCELTNWWIESHQHQARLPSPPSSPISLYHRIQVHLQTRLITASEYISKFTRSLPSSVSPNSLHYRLQVHLPTLLNTASKCISKFTRSLSSSAPRIALKHRLQPVQVNHV